MLARAHVIYIILAALTRYARRPCLQLCQQLLALGSGLLLLALYSLCARVHHCVAVLMEAGAARAKWCRRRGWGVEGRVRVMLLQA